MRTAPDLEALYTRFHDRLRAFIHKRVSNDSAAEDLLQDVFLKIHARIGTLEDESRIESWVYQVTRNIIVDHYRSRKEPETLEEKHHPVEELVGPEPAEQLAPAVREFVAQLPDPYREALVMTEFEGLSQRELAERVGISAAIDYYPRIGMRRHDHCYTLDDERELV